MGDERDFKFNITGDASGVVAAGNQTEAALQGVAGATGRATEANEEHGKSFLHAESSGKAFHKLLHEITEVSPEMGIALRLALSPVGGVIMAAVYAFKQMHDAEKEAEAAAAELFKVAALGLGNMKESTHEATIEIGDMNRQYAKWKDAFLNGSDNILGALDLEIARIEAEKDAINALILAEAKRDRALGKNPTEPNDALKDNDRKAALAEMAARQQATDQETVKQREAQASIVQARGGLNDVQEESRGKDYPKQIGDLDKSLAENSPLKKAAAEAQKKADADAATYARYKQAFRKLSGMDPGMDGPAYKAMTESQQKANDAQGAVQKTQQARDQLQRESDALISKHKDLEDQLRKGEAAADAAAKAIERLTNQNAKQKIKMDAQDKVQPKISAAEADERALNTPLGKQISLAEQADIALQRGGRPDRAQGEAYQGLGATIATMTQALNQMGDSHNADLAKIKEIVSKHGHLSASKLAELEREMEIVNQKLGPRMRNLLNNPS